MIKERGLMWALLAVVGVLAIIAIVASTSNPELAPRPGPSYGDGSGDSGPPVNETHYECVDFACALVAGPGPNTCSSNTDCNVTIPMPDLHIEEMDDTSGGCSANNQSNLTCSADILVVIENRGTAQASNSTARLTVGGFTYYTSILEEVPALNPGDRYEFETNLSELSPGNYTATSFADFFDVVEESIETNNEESILFDVP